MGITTRRERRAEQEAKNDEREGRTKVGALLEPEDSESRGRRKKGMKTRIAPALRFITGHYNGTGQSVLRFLFA